MKKLRHAHDDPKGEMHSGVPWSVLAAGAREYWQGITAAIRRPWWAYSVSPNCRRHEGLSDLVFRFDDPVWLSLYPPNGRDCMCCIEHLRAEDVEKRRFGTATYRGREVPVVGKNRAENRGYRMHRLSADRRPVTPDSGWLGRPVACVPDEVYRGASVSHAGGGFIVPPDVSLPYGDPEDRHLPVATRRLAALRIQVTVELAQILLAESAGQAVSRATAVLWAQAWNVDLEDGAALAAQSEHVAAIQARGLDLEAAATLSANELQAEGVILPGTGPQRLGPGHTRRRLHPNRDDTR